MKKYKLKTHSGAKRRFYVSGTGKILRRKAHFNHLRRKKRPGTLRLLDAKLPLPTGQARRVRKLLPYS
ncbi:MAG: 50S ribosomal protein L35 [Chloroflexi bacterium]|nr:50S ribosomal protein L35 [Chloroflexota bacterium]